MRARRYVILRHDGIPDPHFDLMFEQRSTQLLATLRSAVWPIERLTPLVHLEDHRRDYLEYEGPVTNNRGWVRRVESGMYVVLDRATGEWEMRLKGAADEHSFILRCAFRPGEVWEAEPLTPHPA